MSAAQKGSAASEDVEVEKSCREASWLEGESLPHPRGRAVTGVLNAMGVLAKVMVHFLSIVVSIVFSIIPIFSLYIPYILPIYTP